MGRDYGDEERGSYDHDEDVEHGGHHQGDDELVGGDHADEGHVGDIHLGRDLQGGSIWEPSIICAGRAPRKQRQLTKNGIVFCLNIFKNLQ